MHKPSTYRILLKPTMNRTALKQPILHILQHTFHVSMKFFAFLLAQYYQIATYSRETSHSWRMNANSSRWRILAVLLNAIFLHKKGIILRTIWREGIRFLDGMDGWTYEFSLKYMVEQDRAEGRRSHGVICKTGHLRCGVACDERHCWSACPHIFFFSLIWAFFVPTKAGILFLKLIDDVFKWLENGNKKRQQL